jgi:hypothetical protein
MVWRSLALDRPMSVAPSRAYSLIRLPAPALGRPYAVEHSGSVSHRRPRLRRGLRAPAGEGCPICGSGPTELARSDVEDFEYFVKPVRPFVVRRCLACECEYLDPRPRGDELPGFYPSDYHAYNEDHGRCVDPGVSASPLPRPLPSRASRWSSGRLFDVGAGDCRHFDEPGATATSSVRASRSSPRVAARGRARGYVIVDGML